MSLRLDLAVLALLLSARVADAQTAARFANEKDAAAYCAGGGVVWLDFPHKLYFYKGSPHYGKGADAAYVCESEAAAVGARPVQSHR